MSIFSDRFEQIREYIGISATAFAERLGVPYRSYMNYKAGRTPPPELLTKLVEEFDVNASWLMTGEGEMILGSTVMASAPLSAEDESMEDYEYTNDYSYDEQESPSVSSLDIPMPAAENDEPPEVIQMRMMKHLMDLHEENRRLRKRVEELEIRLKRERTRTRRQIR